MKEINNYIFEKLKINKDSKINFHDSKMNNKVILELNKDTKNTGLVDRFIEIIQLKSGYKANLWNCGKMHWKSNPNKPLVTYKAKDIDTIMDFFKCFGWNIIFDYYEYFK